MGAGFYGEIVIRITADTAGLQKGMAKSAAVTEAGASQIANAAKKSGAHWERAGLAMQNFGRTMTQFVTLPVAAGFAVATVAGYRYEKTLLKLKNLTGLTAAQTAKYGETMKELGPQIGVGPQALAEAMYFVSSSGFKAAEALKVVTVSAKASASGMGDVQVITDAVTSAMNSFGHENLSAARAVDIMMKTIQVGKAEPQALATSLGRIMPVAAQLGVEFNQLGGMIAGLTLGGLSAAEAVTSLRGTMFALVAPGKQAAKEMANYGLTVGQIKGIIKNQGLLEALQLMYEKTNGNELAMKRMIPNVRALNGVLSMLGPNYKNTQRTIDEVTNSQGKLNEAFNATKNTAVFKMDQAIASIKSSFTDIGQKILPAVAGVLKWVSGILSKFQQLSPATQEWIGKLLLVTAVLGPILMMMGSLVRSAALLKMAFGAGNLFSGLASLGGFAGAGGIGVTLAGAATAGLAVAIAAAAATAITAGLDAGIKQAKANQEQKKGFWEDFWSTFIAVPKGMAAKATEVSNWLDELLGGAGGERRMFAYAAAQEALAQRISTAWGQAAVRLRYIKEDLDKAFVLPAVDKALTSKIPQTKAELMNLRRVIMTELNITKREATQIMRLLFPADWGKNVDKGAKDAGRAVDDLGKRIKKLTAEMNKRLAFGDIKGADKIRRQIDDLTGHWSKAKTKVDKANKDLGNATRYVSEGINKHSGGVKGATNRLVDFIQLPLGKMGPKFRKNADAAMKALGDGMDKASGVAKKVTRAVNDAIKAGETSAAGATAIGSALESGAASTITGTLMAGAMRSAVQSAIDAGMAQAEAASPSRKTMKLGEWMTQGLAIGISKKKAEAMAAAADVASSVVTIFDSMLQIGADVRLFKSEGLPSSKLAKKWADRAAHLIKTIYAAITKELGSLNLLDKEKKDKTIPGKGTKFSALATLASDIGSIFSAFTELTPESVTKMLAGIRAARAKAKVIAKAVGGLIRSFQQYLKVALSEFQATSTDNALNMAGGVAGLITSFVEITPEAVTKAMAGIAAARSQAATIAAAVAAMVKDFRKEMGKLVVTEGESGNADRATGIAGNIANIISTFTGITGEKGDAIDLAVTGLEAARAKAGVLAAAMKLLVDDVVAALTGSTATDELAALSGNATSLASDLANTITTFSEMTAVTVTNAIAGMGRVVTALPSITPALLSIIRAMDTAFKDVIISEELSKASSASAALVSDLAGMLDNLTKMTSDAIRDAIWGAGWVAKKAPDLAKALKLMIDWLNYSLQGINADSLAVLNDSLRVLAEIAAAIAGIVDSLSGMTADKLAAANTAGASLGEGFYAGLLSWHQRIVDEAAAIASDTAAALGSPVAGGVGGGPVAPVAVSGGSSAKMSYIDNSRVVVNLPPSLSPAQAQAIAQREIGAFEARKSKAASAAVRGMVRG